MITEAVNVWDPILQFEKADVLAEPVVIPGCLLGSVRVSALLRMAVTTRDQWIDPNGGSAPTSVEHSAFTPIEEHPYGESNPYI